METSTRRKVLNIILAGCLLAWILPPLVAYAQQDMLMSGVDSSTSADINSSNIVRTVRTDSKGNLTVVDAPCANIRQTVVSVGTTAVACPTTALSDRRLLFLCNSSENSGTPKVKVLMNSSPVMGLTNAGMVLAVGDCANYAIPDGTTPYCISDTAATAVTVDECE